MAIVMLVLFILVIFLFIEMHIEKRRNRILQSFIAGIIKSVSDYVSMTDIRDVTSAEDIVKNSERRFPIPYNELLQNISKEFEKDFWMSPYWKWLKNDRNLFYINKYANDGFNMIYWDFFDKAIDDLNEETDA